MTWWQQDETISGGGDWWANDKTVAPAKPARGGKVTPRMDLKPTGSVHDGDTFALNSGENARLLGVDAFELDQNGRTLSGSPVPLGVSARNALAPYATPNAFLKDTGQRTYGRPVVSLNNGGDAGNAMVAQGLALPEPQYLAGSPNVLAQYIASQRDAIANERGAYAGQYQRPSDYRKQGDAAPYAGKTPIPEKDRAAWDAMLRDPRTTRADLEAFLAQRGQKGENLDNIASFARRNPEAETSRYYQQQDATGEPVQAGGVNMFARGAAQLNEGLSDALGAPVDLVNMGLAPIEWAFGLTPTDKPLLGSKWWRENVMHPIGAGATDERYAPRSDAERYGQAFLRGAGSALLPAGGSIAAGGRLALRAPALLGEVSAARGALRSALIDAARNPGATAGLEAGAGIGSYVAGQGADDLAPGNPYAQLAAQTLGGIAGGVGTARAFHPTAPRSTGVTLTPDQQAFVAARVRAGDAEGALSAMEQFTGNPRTPEAISTVQANIRAVQENAAAPIKFASGGVAPDTAPLGGQQMSTPEGLTMGGPDRAMPMDATPAAPSVSAPAEQPGMMGRKRDVIDVSGNLATPLLDSLTDAQRYRAADRINPNDLLPLPSSRVGGVDEAAAIEKGRYAPVRAPSEMDALELRVIPSPNDPNRLIPKRGPLDLVTWLRSQGGVRPEGGELAGIDNGARAGMDFAGGEQRLGKLVNPEGMSYDDAAWRAWEAGYFPTHQEPPTTAEFLDALHGTYRGDNRVFRPEDAAEIDAFNRTRDERQYIQQAQEANGGPFVNDRSQSVSMADMDANAAPVEAYHEWGSNAPNYAGNLRLDKLESPQDIKRALYQVEQVHGLDAARRGRISQAETESLAADLGMTPDQLLKRRKGQAFNAEEALAARQILAKSGNELVNMAKRMAAKKAEGQVSDADLADFRAAIVRHAAIQEQVSGATAEAGRALSQFRMEASSRAVKGNVLKNLIANGGGREGIENAADAIIEAANNSPAKLNDAAQKLASPKFKDKAIELYYNMLLSGPRTHAVNITSNLLTSLAQIPEHTIAAGVGAARRALPGQEAERVLFSETGGRIVGFLQGAREGFAQFGRALKTGEPADAASKVEAQSTHAISGTKGELIRLPTRLLTAEDELFKAMARKMEIAGLAMRKARSEGLSGAARRKRVAELNANPTPEMLDQAADYGRYVTFQRPLGEAGNAGVAFLQKAWPLKLFIPFVRTPTNLVKFAAERSPAAPALWAWSRDFKAGGAKRDLAIARWMVGSAATMMAVEAAQKGLITGGGPSNEKAKNLLIANGWQPYSVKVGNRYVAYGRLDPFSTTIGLAADYVDRGRYMTDKERDRYAETLMGAAIQNLSNKTWLQGMSNLAEALNDPGRYGENTIASLAASGVPAIVAQTATALDPVQRDAKGNTFGATVGNRILSRIPGVSQTLPARRDVLGRTLPTGNGGGLASMSPIYSGVARNDPTLNALLLGGAGLSRPQRTVTLNALMPGGGQKIELTGKQYERYSADAGAAAKPELDALVSSPFWKEMTPKQRQDEVDKIMKRARLDARRGVLAPLVAQEPFWANDEPVTAKRP